MTKPIKWPTCSVTTNSLQFGLISCVQVLIYMLYDMLLFYSCTITGKWVILDWLSILYEIYLIRHICVPASRDNPWYLSFLTINSLFYFCNSRICIWIYCVSYGLTRGRHLSLKLTNIYMCLNNEPWTLRNNWSDILKEYMEVRRLWTWYYIKR